MPLDPAISLDIKAPQVQPVGPLDMMGKLALTQNAINQNKLFQQQFQAKQGLSDAYSAAMDPTTGKLDQNKLMQAVSKDPRTAFMMGDIIRGQQEQQQRDLSISGTQLEQAHKSMGMIQGQISSLLSQDQVTPRDVIGKTGELLAAGAITKEAAASVLSGMPQDPTQIKPWLQQHLLGSMDAQQRLTAMHGAPQVINSGGAQQIVQTSPLTGQTRVDGVVKNTPNPDALLPYGNMTVADRANVALRGADTVAIPQANGTSQVYTRGALAGTGGVGQTPGGIVPVGQTPQLGADRSANLSVDALAQDRQDAASAPGRIYQLGQALSGLQNAQTGHGSETLNNLRGLAATLGMGDGAKNASYDEANKYLTQYAVNKANTLGGATDSKIATMLSANASTHINNLAAQDVVRANIGLERMGLALQQAFQSSGLPENKWLAFKQDWTAKNDPRVFVLSEMPRDKAGAFVSSLPKHEQEALKAQYIQAVNSGWVPSLVGGANGQ